MDEKTSELMRRFKKRALAIPQTLIARLIQEAQEEALAEAKATLKELWLQAILEQALAQWPQNVGATLCGCPMTPTDPAQAEQVKGEPKVRSEIAAIRKQIAENAQRLKQMEASAEKAPALATSVQTPARPAPEKGEEAGLGYYVYGIIAEDGPLPLPAMGAAAPMDPRYPVLALPYRSIQAVVSQVSLAEFEQEALQANLNDPAWLEAHVRDHHSVLESVVAQQVIIPLKFCTIYRSEDGLREMLAQHHDAFLATLAALQGKKEWGVKVYVQRETLAREIEQSDRICKLKGEMAQKPDGVAYFLKRKLEETISAEMERYSDECAQASHDRLAGHAESSVINPLHSKEISGGADGMILNGAYLVAEEHLADFQSELAKLQEEFGYMGFSLEMTGPWPPYNFVSVGEEGREGDEAICSQGESSSS